MRALATTGRANLIINLNYVIWYYIVRHGGDALQDWTPPGMARPVNLAFWNRGTCDEATPPSLAIVIGAEDEAFERMGELGGELALGGTEAWLLSPSTRQAWVCDAGGMRSAGEE